MQLGNRCSQWKAKAGPFARPPRVELHEPPERGFAIASGDPGSPIANRQANEAVLDPQVDVAHPAVGSVPKRIVDEVGDQLGKQLGAAIDLDPR